MSNEGIVNQQSKQTEEVHPCTSQIKRVSGEPPISWQKTYDERTERTVGERLAFAVEESPLNITQVRRRFDASSTAVQVLHGKDLSGRLAVVTGANSGIGFETTRSLALYGCEVVLACRNQASTEDAIERIATERPATRSRLHFVKLDLGSLKSVCHFVEEMKKMTKHIDYMILNAGVLAPPFTLTEDGIETTFQVSHLSHFYLVLQLETLFDHNSRIVVLSSEAHRFANLPTDNLTVEHLSPPQEKYWSIMAYNNAKLCNILFAQELANRWKYRGISVFSLHPGHLVFTQLQRNWWFYRLAFAILRPFTKSLEQAAATSVYCATASELTGFSGQYFNHCYFCEPSKLAQNENLRLQLWELSEQMIQTILERSVDEKRNSTDVVC